ncbi:MAG: signal peptidase I [Kutzneria sp.]|nr:signal peptidase I [Kutzneria sp.]
MPGRGKRRKRPFWQEWIAVIGAALLLTVGTQTFLARAYVIPSGSMEPTLHGCHGCVDDRVIVDKMVYRFHPPQPGDVIVFHAPDTDWKKDLPADDDTLIKRVIAVGGETVWCDGAKVFVDGAPLHEPYVSWNGSPGHQQTFGPVTVPQDRLWVMGDNRNDSADSRAHQYTARDQGTVGLDDVVGKARAVFWPIDRWQGLSDADPQSVH